MESSWPGAMGLGDRPSWADLPRDDVDLDNGVLRIRHALQTDPGRGLTLVPPKTSRSRRTVPLPPTVVRALAAHRAQARRSGDPAPERWRDVPLVFHTRTGTPIHPRNDYRTFRTLLETTGLRRIRLHDLRHTCASLLLAEGVPARVVMEILGHSAIGVTMNTYSHVSPELARDAMERLDDRLRTGPDHA